MWLIIDSNQTGAFVKRISRLPGGIDGITLNPLIFGELVLTQRVEWIRQLMRFPVRFGLMTSEIMDRCATAPIDKIPGLDTHRHRAESIALRNMFQAVSSIPARTLADARALKSRNMKFQSSIVGRANRARDRLMADNGGVLPRSDDPASVLRDGLGARKLINDVLNAIASRDGVVSTEQGERVAAILENSRLKRWFLMSEYFFYSVAGLWWDQALNVKSPQKDDWTDMTSVLYARNGDLLLTADVWLRRAIDVVEDAVQPSVRLRCVTVADLEAMS